MRVLICGGGTGGHVYPALVVAEALQAQGGGADLLYAGASGSMEERLAGRQGIPFARLECGQMRGKAPWTVARNFAKTARGVLQARRIIAGFRPDAIFSTGGYASAPVLLAGRAAGVPALIYLPDAEPGLTVKLLSRLAARVAVSFDEVRAFFPPQKAVVTGYPVRPALFGRDRDEARRRLSLAPDVPVLLAFGGSQGAQSINRAVVEGLPALTTVAQVVHVVGARNAEWAGRIAGKLDPALRRRYHYFDYLDDEMVDALAAADLVVARAGASTMGEFPAVGLPSILVPYPYSGQHQYANARHMECHGAAMVIDDGDLESRLVDEARRILTDAGVRDEMGERARRLAHPDAAQRLAEELSRIAGRVGQENGRH